MMYLRIAFAALLCMSFAPAPASAQGGVQRLGTVNVTSSRRSDYTNNQTHNIPGITQSIRADFMFQSFTIRSGTTNSVERRDEMEATFDRLIARIEGQEGIALFATEGGFPMPLETIEFDDLYTGGSNTGISFMQFILRLDVTEEDSFRQVRERANRLINGVRTQGRTEITISDDQLLGLDNLPTHRLNLLKDIAEDVTAIREMFGVESIRITGLHRPVITLPDGPLMMQVYIPYELLIDETQG